jgi:uncharacterized Fe-S cluster protein YjdI
VHAGKDRPRWQSAAPAATRAPSAAWRFVRGCPGYSGPGSSAGPWPGKAYKGSEITVYFDAQRCRHFGECLRGLPEVFNGRQRPWIAPDAASAALVTEVIRRCPSGAVHYRAPGTQDRDTRSQRPPPMRHAGTLRLRSVPPAKYPGTSSNPAAVMPDRAGQAGREMVPARRPALHRANGRDKPCSPTHDPRPG